MSHDERQTLASEYTQNTMPNTTTNQVMTPAENQTVVFDGKPCRSSIRGSLDDKNLIPIAEETKSPKSHHIKPNIGSNLSTTNIKGRLMRGSSKQRRLLTAHPARARHTREGNAMLAPMHPSNMSRFQTLRGVGSAKQPIMNYRNVQTLVTSP